MSSGEKENPAHEMRYRDLFENMLDAAALHELIYDSSGNPVDYRFLDVNPAFEELTGLKAADVLNKSVKEVLPQTESYWIENYSRVVLTGEPSSFQNYSSELDRYYTVRAYKTGPNHFAVIFNDVTKNKKAEIEKEITIQLLHLINGQDGLNLFIKNAVELFRNFTGCTAAGIRLKEGEDFPYYESSGFSKEFLKKEMRLCVKDESGNIRKDEAGNPLLECVCGQVLSRKTESTLPFFTEFGSFWSPGISRLKADYPHDKSLIDSRGICGKFKYESIALIPLRSGEEVFGLLQLNDTREGLFTPEKIKFLEYLAEYFAVGLAKKKTDNLLAENEKKLRMLAKNVSDVIWVLNPVTKEFKYISPSVEKLLGYKEDEKLSIEILLTPESRQKAGRLLKERIKIFAGSGKPFLSFADDLDQVHKNGSIVPTEITTTYIHDHDGNIEIVGVTRDISERRKNEQELTENRKLLESLTGMIPDVFYLFDIQKNRLIYANKPAVDIAVFKGINLKSDPENAFLDVIHPDDRWAYVEQKEQLKNAADNVTYSYECRVKEKRNSYNWFYFREMVYQRDAEGKPELIFGICQDVTKQKKDLEALYESEEAARALLNANTDAVALIDTKGVVLSSNEEFAQRLRFERDKLIGKNVFPLLPAEVARQRKAKFNWVIKSGMKIRFIDEIEDRIVDNNIYPVMNKEGNIKSLAVLSRDITVSKAAEEALKASEEKFRRIVETSNEGILVVDDKNELVFINKRIEEMLGYTSDDIIGRKLYEFMLDEDAADHKSRMKKRKSGIAETYERRFKRKDGSELITFISGTPLIDEEGKFNGSFAMVTDITERKRAEENLRKREAEYHELYTIMRLMSDTMPDMLWAKDLEKKFIFANKAICERLLNAKDTKEPLGKTDLYFAERERASHPENPEWHTFGELCMDSDKVTLDEMKEMQFDEWGNVKGKFLYLDVHKAPLYNNEGKLIGIVGSARDITVRKAVEEALKQSDLEFKKAQKYAHVGSWVWDIQNNSLVWSDEMFNLFGVKKEEFDGDLNAIVEKSIHPDDLEKVKKANLLVIEERRTSPMSYRIVLPDGTIRYMWAEPGELVEDKKGNPILLRGIVQDITERKIAEQTLKESQLRYHSIFYDSPLGMWEGDYSDIKIFADRLKKEGAGSFREYLDEKPDKILKLFRMIKIREMNRSSLKILGAESISQIREKLPGLFTPESVGLLKEGLISMLEGKQNYACCIQAKNLRGKESYFDVILEVQPGYEESLSRVVMIFSDITERRNNEKFIQMLYELALKLGQTEQLNDILNMMLDSAIEISGMKFGTIYVVDRVTGSLVLEAFRGFTGNYLKNGMRYLPETKFVQTVMKGIPQYITHKKSDWPQESEGEVLASMALIPILHNEKVIAVISLASSKNEQIDGAQRMMVEVLAAQLGGFIARAMINNELVANREHLNNAAKIADLGPWEFNVDSDEYTFNDLIYRMFRISAERAGGYKMSSGDYIKRFVHPDDVFVVNREMKAAVETKNSNYVHYFEHKFLRADGSEGYLAVRVYILKDESGKTIKILGASQDITKRRIAEEEIRSLNARLEAIINASPLAVTMIDKNEIMQVWNLAAENIFGYTADEVIGLPNPLIPEERHDEYKKWVEQISYGYPITSEETVRWSKSGKLIPVSISSSSIYDSNGEYTGRMAIIADISERKKNEKIMGARFNLVTKSVSHSSDELLTITLDEIEKITGSSIGFYHFVEPDQKTLKLQNWSTNTLASMCHAEGKGTHYSIDQAGVWVDCVKAGKPIIHNDYQSLKHKKGMPEGHAPVIREATVPIFRGDKIVAVIGVGNKLTDYTSEDIELIWQLGDLSWDIVDKKRSEEEALAQKNLLSSIFESSPYIIAVVDENATIHAVNRRTEFFTNKNKAEILDRLCGDVLGCINSFNSEGCGRTSNCAQCLLRNSIKSAFETGKSFLNIEGKMEFVIEGHQQEYYLMISATPVVQKNTKLALLTIVDITDRKNAERAVLLSENRLRKALTIAHAGNWGADLKTGKMWISDDVWNMLGIKPIQGDIYYSDLLKLVPPKYRQRVEEGYEFLSRNGGEYEEEFQIIHNSNGEIRYIHSIAETVANSRGEKESIQGVMQDVTEQNKMVEELKESEERYRHLVELSPDALLVHQNDKIVYVNTAALKLFGLQNSKQILGTSIMSWVPREYKADVQNKIAQILDRSVPANTFEGKIVRRDGTEVGIEVIASHFVYKREQAVQVIIRDISERNIFMHALQLSEERFRHISSTISDMAYSCVKIEGSYKIDWLTGASLSVTGYTNEEIMEKQCWGFMVVKDDLALFEKYVTGLLPGQSAQTELRIRKKNGEPAWVTSFAECVEEKSAVNVHLIYGGLVNITERKLMERELIDSEERFRTLIENVPDGLELVDLSGNYLHVNSAACMQLGYSRDELLGMNIVDVIPDMTLITFKAEFDVMPKEKAFTKEVIRRRKDGSKFPAELTADKIKIGEVDRILVSARDISSRKKTEMELGLYRNHLEQLVKERTNEIEIINRKLIGEIEKEREVEMMLRESLNKEKELNELKNRFISTASHEFKTPLTTILSSVELIQRYGKGWDETKLDKHITRVQNSVDHLSKLIDDVLTISRSDNGKLLNNPVQADLYDMCCKYIEDVKPKATSKHELILNFNAGNKIVNVDPKLMRFVVNNLLTNAIKYSPAGGPVELDVNVDDQCIQLKVKDKGIGFPQDDEKHLFEPFFRAKNALEFEGTGLGLSIVKRSVEVMNGEIYIKSKVNKGTVVEIFIPR